MTAVTCKRCGKPAEGTNVPTRGLYMCLTCQLVSEPAPQPVTYAPARRAKWPWLIGAAVLVAAGIAGLLYAQRKRARDDREMRYPIAATPEQAKLLAREAAKWRKGKDALLASIRAFQPTAVTESTKPCPLLLALPADAAYDNTSSMGEKLDSARDRDPDESLVLAHVLKSDTAERVAAQLATLLETADRARFHSVRGRHLAVAATALPLIVMALEESSPPGLTDQDVTLDGVNLGSRKAFVPGHRIGTAYVFDKQTGALACTGHFEASSSESVMTVQSGWGYGSERDAVEIDFENNTVKAIAAAAHAIE